MKKVFLLSMIPVCLFFTACPFDSVVCFSIKNHTNDTILICYARYNNIDSVDYYIGNLDPFQLQFDEVGKIILYETIISYDTIWGIEYCSSDIIFPDSSGRYYERGFRNSFFISNKDKKGYFFVIKLETVRDYTWEEIRKNKLYYKLIVTIEMLKKNDWRIDYYGKENRQ
ncbi:MAG: hypothetical protein FWG85_03360 [Bacteroidetes bacterium]|nr:hypothetical protein [Bacteroidota bacterium]